MNMIQKNYSKTVFDTLFQAYKPFLLKIILLSVLGFLGRFFMLSNSQIIGEYIDRHADITPATLMPLFYKVIFITALSFTLTLVFRLFFSTLSALAVSRIYDETTYRVSRFPMYFFDSQPVGKITTRFSSDYGNIFRLFGGPLAEFLSILFDLVTIVILMLLIHPYFSVTIIISMIVYWILLKRNQFKLRHIRRELSTQRAPSIAHFSETVQGASVIRANKKERTFIEKFKHYDSIYIETKLKVFKQVTRFSMELNLLSTTLFALNSLICLKLIHDGIIGVGLTGAILSFTLLLSNTLQMFFEWFSQFEEAFTSVEKLDDYIRLPIEPGALLPAYSDFSTNHKKRKSKLVLKSKEAIVNSEQYIQIQNLSFKYPEPNNWILKDISFNIKYGEKIGIIGRTGSGKSTLITALLKLYPINKGVILVNSVNEEDVEKHRSYFSVISQDQIFLTGTLRDNLDLFNKYSDDEITAVLKKVGISFKLSDPIQEKGQNLSHGEKQLLSLARGLLQKSEIFIFDEATSNVDPQSEVLMGLALTDLLSTKTQIRIAHRLNTILDCDRLIWIDNGEIKKIGPTQEVLEDFKKSR